MSGVVQTNKFENTKSWMKPKQIMYVYIFKQEYEGFFNYGNEDSEQGA